MALHLENLVFSGGGMKGYIHIGVVKALEKYNILQNIIRFCGTSIGAFMCFLLVLGLSPHQIEDLFLTMDLHNFIYLDPQQILSLLDTFGINDGKQLDTILGIILEKTGYKKNITFQELFEETQKELILTGTCLETYKTQYFSRKSTPSMEVRLAVRISMCLPFLFHPIKYENKNYIDGALSNNLPMEVFQNQLNKTIGIILHGHLKNQENSCPKHIIEYGMSLFRCMSRNIDNYKTNIFKEFVIPIHTNTDTVNLELTQTMRTEMISQGEEETTKYIENKIEKEQIDFITIFIEKILQDVATDLFLS